MHVGKMEGGFLSEDLSKVQPGSRLINLPNPYILATNLDRLPRMILGVKKVLPFLIDRLCW
jgi:hypothetical protein